MGVGRHAPSLEAWVGECRAKGFSPKISMPDGFFASSKKRKRSESSAGRADGRRSASNGLPGRQAKKMKAGFAQPTASRAARRDEELDSDGTEEGAGIDDVDLRASDVDPGESDDEVENETPAEKRLRLAKLYLESVRGEIGTS